MGMPEQESGPQTSGRSSLTREILVGAAVAMGREAISKVEGRLLRRGLTRRENPLRAHAKDFVAAAF